MHSITCNQAPARRLSLPSRCSSLVWVAGSLVCLVFAFSAPRAPAQTFVAEWSEADIGRVGPVGLAIDATSTSSVLYVADDPNGRIIKIDLASGTRLAAWGQTGNGPLQFNRPYGVAVDPGSHDIYVAERGNHRVQRITSAGQFVMGWGSLGTAPGQFDAPIGVAADATGNVYVVDHNNNRVEKFHVTQTASGWNVDLVTTWGGTGAANGQFNAPYGITLDAAGNLWVADAQNHRLQKFDPNGKFLASFGSYGTGDGQFVTPTWVNFDSTGNMYVSETNSDPQNLAATDLQNQRVQEFSPTGTFLLKWGSYGEAGGQFKLPFDVVVDNAGNAYVSDYYNTRLQKFSLTTSSTGGTGTGTSQFVNVSSRLHADGVSGHEVIAGFVISGSTPKKLLIRGVGPTLAHLNISNPLPNPMLQIYSGSTVIASNDDWANDATVSAAATKVGAFPLDASSLDAATVVTLQPGNYTAQVLTNGGNGITLVEVYDADGSATAKLVNLSTRGFVDTGDGVLVAGFVVTGSVPKRVLIRGVGPTLAALNVSGPLADPVIQVYDSKNTMIAQNDDWGTPLPVSGGATPATATDISAAETATGAFALPSGSKDSAIVITLQPGAYTAIVSGAGGTTGTGLVEVYELPNQ